MSRASIVGDEQVAPPTGSRVARAAGSGWPVVLATLSVAAGLIHAAVTAAHQDSAVLAGAFAATAAFQAGWALVIVARPSRPALWAGLGVNAVALVAYVVSRTVGLGSLEGVEPVGTPDLTCALLEAAIVVSTTFLLAPRAFLPSYRRLALAPVAAFVVLVTMLTLPAIVTPHDHGAGHSHDASSGIDAHDAEMARKAGTAAMSGMAAGATVASTPEARALVARTKRSLVRWRDVNVALADGYQSAEDLGAEGFEHYIDWALVDTPQTLDPAHPESLVYAVDADGTRRLVSAMYLTTWGTTIAQEPAIGAGGWHTHTNLCWDDQMHVVGWVVGDAGRCYPRGVLRDMPPMLHVWVVPNRCGPFAMLEDSLELGGTAGTKLRPRAEARTTATSPCGHMHAKAAPAHGAGL